MDSKTIRERIATLTQERDFHVASVNARAGAIAELGTWLKQIEAEEQASQCHTEGGSEG